MSASLIDVRETVIVSVCMVTDPKTKLWISREINGSPTLRVCLGEFPQSDILVISDTWAIEYEVALRKNKSIVFLQWFGQNFEPHPLVVPLTRHNASIEELRQKIYEAHLARQRFQGQPPAFLQKAA